MRLIISLSALLISVLFVQIGSGSLGPLDALSGLELNFSPTAIGYIGSAHFMGFFLGCVLSPYIVMRSGHARAFAVMAAISAISILLHPVLEEAWFWMVLRVASGFAVAGAYTVIESWLQSKLNNENRGRVFSIYRMVDMTGTLLSQLIIAGLTPAHYISYNLIAVVACLALVPLALTQTTMPALPKDQKFQPFFVFKLSPLAALGVIVVGLTNSSFRMVAPVYAKQSGLPQSSIAIFLALGVVGGLVAQLPAGIIADRISRRLTLILFSVLSVGACLSITWQPVDTVAGIPFIYIGGFLFGFATLPIYSICASHASDFAKKEDMLALSASLIFFFALGAVVAPSFAGYLIDTYGPPALFTFIMTAHIALLLYTLWRYIRRPVTQKQRPYNYMPRTTLYIAHLARRRKKSADREKHGVWGR
ncbi:MAG: MFS transporter [Pseudomonadota bacterium]